MPTTVEIQIVVDQEGASHAFQRVGNEFKELEKSAGKVGGTSNAVFTQMRKQQEQARDAAQLLSRAVGAEVPRALEKVLARSNTVGPALATAFNAAVVTSFGVAVIAAVDKLFGFSEGLARTRRQADELFAAVAKANEILAGPKTLQGVNAQIRATESSINAAQATIEVLKQILGGGLRGELTARGLQTLGILEDLNGELDKQKKLLNEQYVSQAQLMDQQMREEPVEVLKRENEARLAGMVGIGKIRAEEAMTLDLLEKQLKARIITLPIYQAEVNAAHAKAKAELEAYQDLQRGMTAAAVAARNAAVLRERMPVAELPPAITELPKWMQEMADQLDKEWASEKEIRGRQMELAGELADAESRAAIASLEPWQKAYAQIQGDAERATREIAQRYGGLSEEADKAARLTTAVWAEAGLRMRDQLAGDLESAFDDITSGNIGKRFLENFKKMVFQMVATWMLGMQQMRTASGFSFGSFLSGLFGFSLPGAGGAATVGAAAAGAAPAFSWTAENALATSGALPLNLGGRGTSGVSLSMAALPLSAGQGAGAGIGAALPAGAAVVGAAGAAKTSWLAALGGPAGLAAMGGMFGIGLLGNRSTLARGIGGALTGATAGLFGGAVLASLALGIPLSAGLAVSLAAAPFTLGLSALVGGLLAVFGFGGPHKGDTARIQVMEPAQRQIKNILDEYNLFQTTLDQAISQLEQLRSQGIERLSQIGGRQKSSNSATLTRWVDEAENQMKSTEAERQRRVALQFGGAMFHSGGYVNPSLARQTVPAWAAGAPRYQSGGAVPALLEPGEYVVRSQAVQRIGRGRLEQMNAGGEGGGITIHINALDARSFSAWLRDGGMKEMVRELRRARAEGAF